MAPSVPAALTPLRHPHQTRATEAVIPSQPIAVDPETQSSRQQQKGARLPPSVVSGIQLTSRDETRDQFKSTQIIEPGLSADGRFAGIIVPGKHSDVGGSYHRDGLAIRSGNLVINYLNGLTEAPQLKLQAERSNPDMCDPRLRGSPGHLQHPLLRQTPGTRHAREIYISLMLA